MSEVLRLKREDPAWLKSIQFIGETVILLQGDDPDSRVSVSAALLVAISPLVRNILANGHLPPSFSTPVISFPSVSVDILERVGEMLVSEMASMDMNRLCGVREVFDIMGIEDWMVIQGESNFDKDNNNTWRDLVQEKTVDDLDVFENCVTIKSEDCIKEGGIDFEDATLDIVVKLENEINLENSVFSRGQSSQSGLELEKSEDENCENPVFLLKQAVGHSCKSGLELEKNTDKIVAEKPSKTRIVVQKQLQVRIARLNHAGNLEGKCNLKTASENKKTETKKHNFSSKIVMDKYSMVTQVTCPQCDKKLSSGNLSKHIREVHNKKSCPHCEKMIVLKNMSLHIRNLHNKETVRCPQCDKSLAYSFLQRHIKFVHKRKMLTCTQCGKKVAGSTLSTHIRTVHNKETTQCPHCDRTMSYTSLNHHIKYVHEQTMVTCPQCDKKLSSGNLSKHIREVHNNETTKCPHCDKTMSYTSLKSHIKYVHEQTMVTCPQCEKKVMNLSQHTSRVHRMETAD